MLVDHLEGDFLAVLSLLLDGSISPREIERKFFIDFTELG
jgi:hypothetical protein